MYSFWYEKKGKTLDYIYFFLFVSSMKNWIHKVCCSRHTYFPQHQHLMNSFLESYPFGAACDGTRRDTTKTLKASPMNTRAYFRLSLLILNHGGKHFLDVRMCAVKKWHTWAEEKDQRGGRRDKSKKDLLFNFPEYIMKLQLKYNWLDSVSFFSLQAVLTWMFLNSWETIHVQ